jgi:hypothetical protein
LFRSGAWGCATHPYGTPDSYEHWIAIGRGIAIGRALDALAPGTCTPGSGDDSVYPPLGADALWKFEGQPVDSLPSRYLCWLATIPLIRQKDLSWAIEQVDSQRCGKVHGRREFGEDD